MPNEFGQRVTPLLIAAKDGHSKIVQDLATSWANLEATDTSNGMTPLAHAAYEGHLLVKELASFPG